MNATELFYATSPFPLEEYRKFFSGFRKEAFRLEMLGRYSMESERQAFTDYLAGKPLPSDLNSAWHETLNNARKDQRTFSRIRVIEIVTPYVKFEIECGYEKNIEHGENIQFLIHPDIESLAQSVPILKDFWLFDDINCFLVEYDFYGRFLGVVRIPDDIVPQYVDFSHKLKEKAQTNFADVLRLIQEE